MNWATRTILTISIVSLPIFLYVAFRISSSVRILYPRLAQHARRVAFGMVLWVFLLPLIILLQLSFNRSGSLFLNNLSAGWEDLVLHYPLWIGVIFAAELVAPFLVLDIAAAVLRRFPARREQARRGFAIIRLVLGGALALYIVGRVVLDTTVVKDSAIRITLNSLPPEFDSLTLTLVSDLQVDRYTGAKKIQQVHDIVAGRKPHILLSGGDIVTSGEAFIETAANAMCDLRGSLGAVAVMGDHDFWSAPTRIRQLQENCGWLFLDNKHHLIPYRGRTILVTGLTHTYRKRLKEQELRDFLSLAPKADLRILITHQPAEMVVRLAAQYRFDLILAGHTHGGQIVLHPLGIPLTPSMTESRFYEGHFEVDSSHVIVTRGIGLTLAPVRYHAQAEVTTVILGR